MTPISQYELQDHIAVELARIYSNEFKEVFFVAVGHYSDCDLVSRSGNVKLEIKCETTPIRTGNVCLEFWNTSLNKPSGVLSTKATVWLHLVLETQGFVAYEYDIDTLRRLVIEHGVVKSNGRNALCKIIPLGIFKKYARRSFPLQSRFVEEVKMQGGINGSTESKPTD